MDLNVVLLQHPELPGIVEHNLQLDDPSWAIKIGLLSNQGGLGLSWDGCAVSARLSQYPRTVHELHTLSLWKFTETLC